MLKKREQAALILRSEAFNRAQLRSERLRILATISTLLIVVVFVFVRDLFVDLNIDFGVLAPSLVVMAIMLAYELVIYVKVGWALRDDRRLGDGTWIFNMVFESLLPTSLIVLLTLTDRFGPYRALVAPVVYFYFVLAVLSTLRLQPVLCLLSGLVSALAYLGVTLWTFWAYPDQATVSGAFHLSYYVTASFMILIGGALAAGVADQIRSHLAAELRETARRQKEVLKSRDALIFGLAKLAEYRDTDTGTHLERIASYSALLADAMRDRYSFIDDSWVETLRVASSMHDIGKVGIPDNILQKPGRLTDEERTVIERHPTLGAEVLTSIREKLNEDPLMDMSISITASHHERWDGKGYQKGLKQEEIDLSARVISVADVYDALTSKRVYKEAMPHEEAVRIIREGRGTQFDPDIVDAFERIADQFDSVRAATQDVGQDPQEKRSETT